MGRASSLLGTACAFFSICYKAAAPQFTYPVNNLNIGSAMPVVEANSHVNFSWLPPRATCGLANSNFRYDFEIKEILDNQTVTDATYNPYIFRKTSLPSNNFLLDTNLYRNVLQPGKKYAIRVRATSSLLNSPVVVDNEGYSRVEAFTYGSNPENMITQFGAIVPEQYLVSYNERKTDYWDDVFAAFTKGQAKDTLVPLRQFIGLKLMQRGLAYNIDAIELFLALNPELINVRSVKISHQPKFPQLPPVSAQNRKTFDLQHKQNLQPDAAEFNRYLRLLDSLNLAERKNIPDSSKANIYEVIRMLNGFKTKASDVNRVSMALINQLLSELVYNLRMPNGFTNNDYRHLQDILTDLKELSTSADLSFNNHGIDQHQNHAAMFKLSFANYQENRQHTASNILRSLIIHYYNLT